MLPAMEIGGRGAIWVLPPAAEKSQDKDWNRTRVSSGYFPTAGHLNHFGKIIYSSSIKFPEKDVLRMCVDA